MPENWEILVILVEFTQKQGDLQLMYGVDWGWDGSFMVNGDLPQQIQGWMGMSQLIGQLTKVAKFYGLRWIYRSSSWGFYGVDMPPYNCKLKDLGMTSEDD